MPNHIAQNVFTDALFLLLEETFEKTHGIILDRDATLFHSLAGLTAEQASRPIAVGGTTIASQVYHVKFYLEIIEQYMQGIWLDKVDWQGSWTKPTVTAEEWAALTTDLRTVYERISAQMRSFDDWNDEKRLGGALGVIVHTAYHLGAIRQIYKVVR